MGSAVMQRWGGLGVISAAAAVITSDGIMWRCGGTWHGGSRPAAGRRGDRRHRVSQGRHGVAVRGPAVSGTLGKTANCQVAVSVHLVNEHASCAADWRLFCPQSWDDTALADPVAAARARRRRAQARIPDDVRHREKWRLALEMLDEILARAAGACWSRSRGRRHPAGGDAMPATGTTPASGWSWRTAAGSTWSRSRAPPARMQAMRAR